MDRLHPPEKPDQDALNDLLGSLRIHTTVYCHSEMRAPWGFAVAAKDVCAFHIVLDGACWLEVDGTDSALPLETGDVVLLVTGRGHRVKDDPSSHAEWLEDILSHNRPDNGRLTYGETGPTTKLLCGGFLAEGSQASPLLMNIPPVLRIQRSDPAATDWLDGLLRLLRAELSQPKPGAGAVLSALTDTLVTQIIRSHLLSFGDSEQAEIAGLRDSRVAKAVRLAHDDPSRAWSVDELAAEVAMSRSAFASIFRDLTGESPMRYVTRCRLARAASYLADGGISVAAIARRTGYDSESSFTKAFSRQFGMAPGAYRRSLHDPSTLTRALREVDRDVDHPPL